MSQQQTVHHTWLRYVVAVALVAFAAALRVWPLQALGSTLVWLTFYPAVMVVALYGGLSAGLLATAQACFTVIFLWPLLVAQPFIAKPADWLGMTVFIFTGTMISSVAEAMKRANARAKLAQQQAEAANRAKSVFLATMSHELRTPLNAILGFSALMHSDPGITAEQRENLDIINRSGQHLLSLINDVLDMAKIEAGQVALEIRPFDMCTQMRDIIDMLRGRAEEKGLELRLDQPPDLPCFINGDAEKLRQVIVNLVSNAVKYTQQGSVTLRLGLTPNGDTQQLTVEVEDTGIGIDKTDQARIFEAFVQVGKPATQKGTGLGLAIVREFIELMGGDITVESEPEKGSLFRVKLPVQIAEEPEVMPLALAKGRVIGLEPGQPEYRILIVEDQVENQLLLRRMLENVGFTVALAENGAEGIASFQSFRPHFIWMDRRMPIMDGLEATRRIRALNGGKEVKIVVVSASVFDDQRAETLAQGVDDFVHKPYRPTEIFECMERHLGVRYVYGSSKSTDECPAFPAAALLSLPEVLRRELADALINGNTERIAGLMLRVEQQDAALAKVLARHLDHFNYLPILQTLESANQRN